MRNKNAYRKQYAVHAHPRDNSISLSEMNEETDHRKCRDQDVPNNVQWEKHRYERISCTTWSWLVLHVGHVRVTANKRHDPKRRQQRGKRQHLETKPQLLALGPHHKHERYAAKDEQ